VSLSVGVNVDVSLAVSLAVSVAVAASRVIRVIVDLNASVDVTRVTCLPG
jgi:hypothetical protein